MSNGIASVRESLQLSIRNRRDSINISSSFYCQLVLPYDHLITCHFLLVLLSSNKHLFISLFTTGATLSTPLRLFYCRCYSITISSPPICSRCPKAPSSTRAARAARVFFFFSSTKQIYSHHVSLEQRISSYVVSRCSTAPFASAEGSYST